MSQPKPQEPQRPSRRGGIRLWIKLAVSGGLLALILQVVPWSRLLENMRALDARVWLAVLACFLAGHVAGAFKWRLNVNIGRARLGRADALQCYAAGLFANLCLPSIVGGDGLKALLAGRLTGRYEAAIFGGLAERLIDTAALLALIVCGAALSGAQIPGWEGRVLLVGAGVGVAAAVLFLPLLLRTRMARWPRKLRRPLGRAMVAMRRLRRRPQTALLVLAMSLAIQTWFVVLNAWLGRGIGIELPFAVWLLAIPLAKAVTLLPISLGGFGVRELTLASLLGFVGVAESQGVTVSLLWQTIVVATGLLGGLAWLLLGLRPSTRAGAQRMRLLEVARGPAKRAVAAPGSRRG